MPRRLLLALIVLVAAPLVLLGWVSATAMRRQQELASTQLRNFPRDGWVPSKILLVIIWRLKNSCFMSSASSGLSPLRLRNA